MLECISRYCPGISRYCPGILRYGARDSVGASALLDQRSWCPGKREQQQQDMTSAKSCNLAEMEGFWEKSSWIGIALFTKITSSSFKYGSCSILSPLLGVGYKGGLSFETIRKSDFCGISGKSPSQRHMSKKGDNKKIRFRLTVI